MNTTTQPDKANDKVSTESKAARAEANQRFVRETLVRRQPRYARMVERVAEAVVRDMARCCGGHAGGAARLSRRMRHHWA